MAIGWLTEGNELRIAGSNSSSRRTNISFLYLPSAVVFQSADVWAESTLNSSPSPSPNVGSNLTTTLSSMTDEEILKAVMQVDGLGRMTVNERLFASGLMTEFDNAKRYEKDKARKILEFLKVDKSSINKIIK